MLGLQRARLSQQLFILIYLFHILHLHRNYIDLNYLDSN